MSSCYRQQLSVSLQQSADSQRAVADQSSDAAEMPLQSGSPGPEPPQQSGNPGAQLRPVHRYGQPYQPNILRFMKYVGFKEQKTSPRSWAVPGGTPPPAKLARAIDLAQQAQQRQAKLPGPDPNIQMVEQVAAPPPQRKSLLRAPALFTYTIVISVDWHMRLAFMIYAQCFLVCTQIQRLHMKSIRSKVACNLMLQYLGDVNASLAGRRAAELQRVITDFQRFEGDTGSSEVQGAASS